jgi:hypothetical protein
MTCRIIEDGSIFLVIEEIPGKIDSCYGEHNTREAAQKQCDIENDDSSDCEDRLRLMKTGF